MPLLLQLILPVAVEIVKAYIKSSSSAKDDLILETVKDSCYYLASKDNNDLGIKIADDVAFSQMKGA